MWGQQFLCKMNKSLAAVKISWSDLIKVLFLYFYITYCTWLSKVLPSFPSVSFERHTFKTRRKASFTVINTCSIPFIPLLFFLMMPWPLNHNPWVEEVWGGHYIVRMEVRKRGGIDSSSIAYCTINGKNINPVCPTVSISDRAGKKSQSGC